MARAIVTFCRGWQALAITRSLGRQGIEVFCGEEARFAPSFFSKYCTGSFQYPSVSQDPVGFLDFMEEKVKELAPADGSPYVLVPVHKETWLFAKHRERFEPHIRLPITSYENMARVHDKGRLPDLARELEIRIPETHAFRSLEAIRDTAPSLSYPRFLKVREGASGVGLKKVNSEAELVQSFAEFIDGYNLQPDTYPLVQEFVEGQDYCVTALFDHGKCVANMTYRNLRAFPRDTGAGSLREAVELPEAEAESVRLLEHLQWHGIAELDFRQAPDGPAYLIEVNPRFFGGLPQAIAANVDYPHLLYRIANGERIDEQPQVDYSKRTETPITGLLATLDEIAHDKERWARLDKVRREFGAVVHADAREAKNVSLRPFWNAIKQAANPRDIKSYLSGMFESHQNTIDDVLQKDDPLPALGFLYPVALMLKHRKLSMGVLTSEQEIDKNKPRRRLRDLLRQPTWSALLLTASLFAASIFLAHWAPTSNNIGFALGFPGRIAQTVLGPASDLTTLGGAIKHTIFQTLNLLFLYLVAAIVLRQSRTKYEARQAEQQESPDLDTNT